LGEPRSADGQSRLRCYDALKQVPKRLRGAELSVGVRHLVVNGTPVIRDGARQGDARPGRAVRRRV
jgi:hypothetical protein